MDQLKQKLTSQSGASITYALLLFLVCAVVSAVVLTAGTAAAGRISGSVDNDQRYYSVTSAVKYLINSIDGKSCKIKTVSTTSNESTTSSESEVTIGGEEVSGNKDIAANASLAVAGVISPTYPQTISLSAGNIDSLDVSIEETIENDTAIDPDSPVLKLDVSNADEDAEGTFTIQLIFTCGIDERTGEKTLSSGTTQTTVTKEVTWNFYSMETL